MAHEVLESKQILEMEAGMNIEFTCMLPPIGTTEEPAWLGQFRHMKPEDTAWTEQLDDDMAQVETFPVSP